MRDYWCSAMVRPSESKHWILWTARIQAGTLSAARACAIRVISEAGYEFGALDMIWDTCTPVIATEADYGQSRKAEHHEAIH